MFDKINLNDMLDLADSLESARYYGFYQGRGSFEGYGIIVDNISDLIKLGARLEEFDMGSLANIQPHIDNMGRGFIVAWSARYFAGSTDPHGD
jgi:hypothetical protein